jgi:hypothetical protein
MRLLFERLSHGLLALISHTAWAFNKNKDRLPG